MQTLNLSIHPTIDRQYVVVSPQYPEESWSQEWDGRHPECALGACLLDLSCRAPDPLQNVTLDILVCYDEPYEEVRERMEQENG